MSDQFDKHSFVRGYMRAVYQHKQDEYSPLTAEAEGVAEWEAITNDE